MPIDINMLRIYRGGEPEIVRKSEIQRCRDGKIVDEVVAADEQWRTKNFEMEQAKCTLNATNKEIGVRKKTDHKAPCDDLVSKAGELKNLVGCLESEALAAASLRNSLLHKIGNILHPSVLATKDEAQNEVVRSWGNIDRSWKADGSLGRMFHHKIMGLLGMVDLKKGVELAGHRGYFLKGAGVMLNLALINYGMSFLRRRGYTDIQPPFFMSREVMTETAELADFESTLYKIPGSREHDATEQQNTVGSSDGRDDLFLIATSEQPISALHRGECLDSKTLPIKYAGVSTCFRKEAGSHGKDMWGIFRVHQFEKVEQFVLTTPEASDAMHNEMIGLAEEFYQSLDIPYRVVSIVGGALNDAASKKYDLEAWFPGHCDYRELVSCSNCLDYQSRALNIHMNNRDKNCVHMLNATLVATQRAMCCILENFQTPEGVAIPRVLIPYMDGIEFLRFPKGASAAADPAQK